MVTFTWCVGGGAHWGVSLGLIPPYSRTETGGAVCRKRRALTQALEERGPRHERGGGGKDLEEDEHFNIQVQQAVQAMSCDEKPTRKAKSAPTKTSKSVRKSKTKKEITYALSFLLSVW